MDIDERLMHYLEGIVIEVGNLNDPKARYDRYVCAVLTGNYNQQPFKIIPPDEVVALALDVMLAADKRWEEYTKGGEDDKR